MDAPTVANKFANLIVDIECKETISKETYAHTMNDPDEIFYSDDEIYQSEDEEEHFGEENINFSFQENIVMKKIEKIKKDCLPFLANRQESRKCRCGLGKQVCFAMDHIF